jgi:hypothetical protein
MFFQYLLSVVQSTTLSSLTGSVLQLLSALINLHSLPTVSVVDDWLLLIETYSCAECPDHLRLSSVLGLKMAAPTILLIAYCQHQTDKHWNSLALRLLKVILHLLSDAHIEIREIACDIVSSILLRTSTEQFVTQSRLQYSHAIQLLLTYITTSWCQTVDNIVTVYQWLEMSQIQHCFNDRNFCQLFMADDVNPFLELYRIHIIIHASLKQCIIAFPGELQSTFEHWLVTEMCNMTSVLHNSTHQLTSTYSSQPAYSLQSVFKKRLYEHFVHSFVVQMFY